MSPFDSIRYPISEQPTKEEFGALPDPIWRAWRDAIKGEPFNSTFEFRLAMLRKIILEYDDNLPCNQVSS